MTPFFTIGKDGIGENLIKQADDALEARELIKGRVLDNNIDYDARTAAEELAKATRSEVVQVIGTKFVLYRESHSKPKEKRIQLVKACAKRRQAPRRKWLPLPQSPEERIRRQRG